MPTQIINTLFLALIIISTTLLSTCLSDRCNPDDKKTLLQIKKAFNDPYALSSWDPQTGCCGWYNVDCDEQSHRIIALSISYGELSGPIPQDVGDLPYLQTLELHKNPNLTGPIPQSLSKLKSLRYLMITWTGVSGPIPDFIGELKALEFVFLSYNSLSGPIPRGLGTLPRLGGLRLDRNRLSGPIPESLGNPPGENFYLYLSHNELSGKIPESFRRKKDFSLIDLSRNRLQGDASALFGPGRETEYVDISRNEFEFDISGVEFQESLTHLDINHNRIFGTLPPDLAHRRLMILNVSYNRLCGKIPVGGELQGFGVTEYFHNRCLCGSPLPECK